MNKKGFTLIELLAVIVILAIIAVIAIPRILNVVEEAKKGSAESSALGYIDAIEKYILNHDINPVNYPYDLKGKQFDISKETNGVPRFSNFLKVKGSQPVKGNVTIDSKGKVTNSEFTIDGYKVICQSNKCTVQEKNVQLIVSSITIKTNPIKTSYISGDTLDLTGLEIAATYENSNDAVLDYTDIVSVPAHDTILTGTGQKTITISYGTGANIKNASFTVNVDPIRIPYKSSNTFDYNGYNGDMSNYTSTTRNSSSTLSGAPYIELPNNVVGKTLNVKYELDQTYSNFQIAFIDKDDNIIGNAYWYCNPANASDMKLSRVGMTSTYNGLPIELGDIQNNNILSTASLVIPSGSKYVKILQFNTSHGAKVYDTYIVAN